MKFKYEKNPKFDKFVNQILNEVVLESPKITGHNFFEQSGLFKFITIDGVIDFYAQSDKISFNGTNNWQLDGLNKLLTYIDAKAKKPKENFTIEEAMQALIEMDFYAPAAAKEARSHTVWKGAKSLQEWFNKKINS